MYMHFLANTLLPFMQAYGHELTFQQDNARPHTARLTANFLVRNHVNVLPGPAVSPDMNPIEHT
jgi:transposase